MIYVLLACAACYMIGSNRGWRAGRRGLWRDVYPYVAPGVKQHFQTPEAYKGE